MCVFFMHVVPLMQVVRLFLRVYLTSFKANGVSVIQLVPDHVYDWFDVKRLQCKMDRHRYFFHIHVVPPINSKHHPLYLISIQTRVIFCYSCWGTITKPPDLKKLKKLIFHKTWKHLEYFIRIYLQTIHHH